MGLTIESSVKPCAKWYNYRDCTTTPCDSGYYYYFYDALGNVAGVYDENTDQFIDYEMDAFGNDLPGGNSFLAMDQPGPKEHLTGKMYDTDTGLYYFHARWYDPGVGRFVSRDPKFSYRDSDYVISHNSPLYYVDPTGKEGVPPPVNPLSGLVKMPLHQFLKLFNLSELHPWNVDTAFIGQDGSMLSTRVALTCSMPTAWGIAAAGASGVGIGGGVYLVISSETAIIEASIPSAEDEFMEEVLYQFKMISMVRQSSLNNLQRLERCANSCQKLVEMGNCIPDRHLPDWQKCMSFCWGE